MPTKESIMDAYLFLRENNNTIPDETLEFMKINSLKALKALAMEQNYNAERKEIINYLNEKTNSKFRHNSNNVKKHLVARFNEKFTVEDCKEVIDKKVADWSNTEYEKFLRPETLFGNKFESYLNQKSQKKQTKLERDLDNIDQLYA